MLKNPAVPSRPGVSGLLLVVLALLNTVAPFATDMYLPAFTDMADDLGAGASSVQLTLTAFLIGLAVGQLTIGPLSDRFGRRVPLLIATCAATAAAVVCALSPNVWVLVAARFVQGFAGVAGIVIGRAVAADRTGGQAAAKVFSLLTSISGIAPVVAPLAGGLLVPAGWRMEFWALTGISALMLLGALLVVPESLPPERRHRGGLAATGRTMRHLLADRGYLGYILTFGLGFTGLMGYISASPFVIKNVLGLSTSAYSADFAVNALGMVTAGLINARLIGRFTPLGLLGFGQGAVLTGSAVLLAMLAAGAPAAAVLPVLFLTVSCVAFVMGNSAALALGRARHASGTGAAMMGALQFACGALVSPLVGLGGEETGVPMGIALVTAAVLGIGAHLLARTVPASRSAAPEPREGEGPRAEPAQQATGR